MKKLKSLFSSSPGQALVTLLFFVLIGLTVLSSSAVLVYGNIQSASVTEQGNYAYYIAESGIEEALLRMVRDPNYTGTPAGQPIVISDGSVTVQVSGGVITATGVYLNNVRKIQAQTVYNNNVLTVSSWKEVQ